MIEIRKATPSDAENIIELCNRVGGETDNLTFGAEGLGVTVEDEQNFLESMNTSDKQLFLVAVNDGEIVGTASLMGFSKPRLAHRAELSICVKKSMRGKQIGSRFMEELLRFAKDTAKVRILSLEVRSDNERAIALYKKFGFETIGTFEGFLNIDGNDISFDIMRLCL